MAIGKISTIKQKGRFAPNTAAGSLAAYGLTRIPGTINRMYPAKNIDGSYRTGLDPEASYIEKMPAEEREIERSRVKGLLEKAKQFYPDIDIGPRSSFYRDMIKRSGSSDVAPVADLSDGDNLFDLNDPHGLIKYAYLRVHPNIAPSGQAVLQGTYSKATYYVNDFDVETEVAYKTKTKIGEAVQKLADMPLERRKMVARQLGIGVSDDAKEQAVFVSLYDYINAASDPRLTSNITMFMTLVNMKDENLAIKDLVEQCLTYNVIRMSKGRLYRGDTEVARSKDQLAEFLAEDVNQEDLMSLQEELKIKKSVRM